MKLSRYALYMYEYQYFVTNQSSLSSFRQPPSFCYSYETIVLFQIFEKFDYLFLATYCCFLLLRYNKTFKYTCCHIDFIVTRVTLVIYSHWSSSIVVQSPVTILHISVVGGKLKGGGGQTYQKFLTKKNPEKNKLKKNKGFSLRLRTWKTLQKGGK